jgi:hypothetical protein
VELEVARLQWHRALEIYHPQTRSASGWSVPAGATLVTQETRQQGWTPVPDGFETVTRRVAQRVQDGTETVREPVRVQTGTQTEQYACGTRDLGNGRFETALCTREVPVYGTTTVTKQVPRYTTVEVPVQERVPKYRDVPRYADWYTYTLTECVHVDTLVAQGPDAQPHWPPGVPPLSAACPAQRSEQYPVTFRTVAAAGHQATYPQAVDLEAFTRYRMGARVRGTVNVLGVLADVTPRR